MWHARRTGAINVAKLEAALGPAMDVLRLKWWWLLKPAVSQLWLNSISNRLIVATGCNSITYWNTFIILPTNLPAMSGERLRITTGICTVYYNKFVHVSHGSTDFSVIELLPSSHESFSVTLNHPAVMENSSFTATSTKRCHFKRCYDLLTTHYTHDI